MRFAGLEPNQDWESQLQTEIADYSVSVGAAAQRSDDYHDYLICNWHMKLAGKAIFQNKKNSTGMNFHQAASLDTQMNVAQYFPDR